MTVTKNNSLLSYYVNDSWRRVMGVLKHLYIILNACVNSHARNSYVTVSLCVAPRHAYVTPECREARTWHSLMVRSSGTSGGRGWRGQPAMPTRLLLTPTAAKVMHYSQHPSGPAPPWP